MRCYTAKIKSNIKLNNFLYLINTKGFKVNLFDTEILSSYSTKLMQTIAMATTWNSANTFNMRDYEYFTQSYVSTDQILERDTHMIFITDINNNKLIITTIKDKYGNVLDNIFNFIGKLEDDFQHYVKKLNIDKESITFEEITPPQEAIAMSLQNKEVNENASIRPEKDWKHFTIQFSKDETNYGNYNDCVQILSEFISENPALFGASVDYNYFSNTNETTLEVHFVDTDFTEYLYCKITNSKDTVSITYKTNNYFTSILTNLIEYIEDL